MAKTKLSISLVRENVALTDIIKPGVQSVQLQNGQVLVVGSAGASSF